MKAIPSIETEFGIPAGELRIGGATPCTGKTCELACLTRAPRDAGPGSPPRRMLLCRTHNQLHACDHACTRSDRVCELFAAFLGNKHRFEVSRSWRLERSGGDDAARPNSEYWFNTAAGISAWKADGDDAPPIAATTPHACTRESCSKSG